MRDKKARTQSNLPLAKEVKANGKQSNSVFAIVCSATPELRSIKFYATREIARRELKKLADERRYNLGIHWHEETKDMFFYTVGWEEYPVRFSIVEFPVESK